MSVKLLFFNLFVLTGINVSAQYTQEETKAKKFYVESTFALLGNLLPEEKPDFVQLNFGYRITSKDVVSLEVKTWRYFEPLGIPYGDARADDNENFPGFIREKGFAIVYQRFWWKSLYTGIPVMSAWQSFMDNDQRKIDNGFQIFNTYRLGYHVKLWKNRFFIEPSIAVTHRPYHTDMPESFKIVDDKWSKFFLGEPG